MVRFNANSDRRWPFHGRVVVIRYAINPVKEDDNVCFVYVRVDFYVDRSVQLVLFR